MSASPSFTRLISTNPVFDRVASARTLLRGARPVMTAEKVGHDQFKVSREIGKRYQIIFDSAAGRFAFQYATSSASCAGSERTSRMRASAGQVLAGPSADKPINRPSGENATR